MTDQTMSKTIRVSQISMPPGHSREQVFEKACRLAGIREQEMEAISISRQSVDARKKEGPRYIYAVDIRIPAGVRYRERQKNVQEIRPVSYRPPEAAGGLKGKTVAVIGAGPAGLFCAYLLAMAGYRPRIIERGKPVEERLADVERFWADGVLDPGSNVQFGEGGAGTFSDGKLNTLTHDREGRGRFVLETFVRMGAPEDILYVNKPHIGTDVLQTVIVRLRGEILRLGGTFHFSSQVTDFIVKDGRLASLKINHREELPVSAAVLAIGHSARDTFYTLHERAIPMCAKAFAVGMRVEHPQRMIDENQYGKAGGRAHLPAADYKLTHKAKSGRGVYTFCMCPGGYVVNASSEEGRLAVNGMSNRARDGQNANSAVIMTVTPQDFPDPDDPLSGIAFQRDLEEKAWKAGNGKIPQQLLKDFALGRAGGGYGAYTSCARGSCAFADLREIFPADMCEDFLEGMQAFGRRIKGFDRGDCILSAVESRTSSPVRILRGETMESEISGLYPCGEGAGYAGGIMSAAIDGLKTAEAILQK